MSRTESLSEFPLLTSIPGVGEITATTILGEIGDISRFDSPKKHIAYACLDPSVFQSGKFNAKNNKISKRVLTI
jgi:transposase